VKACIWATTQDHDPEHQGQQIKIGLDVPEHMPVYREELYQKVQNQNASALELDNHDLMMAAALWTSTDRR
jgi:carbon storage regulator